MGISVGDIVLFDIFSGPDFFHEYPNGDKVYSVTAVYITEDIIGNFKIDQREISDVKFFSVNNLPSNMTKVTNEILRKYIKYVNTDVNNLYH